MDEYIEWKNLKEEKDENNKFTRKFVYENGDCFYIEPVYYLKLQGFKQFHAERYDEIIAEMERLVRKNHVVVFVGEEDEEFTSVDGAIYLTVQDVANPLQIFAEDKSRGSDYGD